jgi:uncharacterized HAD superfamily protein
MITDVGVDIDGVLFDFATIIQFHASRELGRDLTYPDKWEFYTDWGLTESDFYNLLEHLIEEKQLFNEGSPYEGVMQGWRSLREQNLNIHIVTHRPWSSISQTTRWLERWRLQPDSIHFTDNKSGVLTALAIEECASIDDYTEQYLSYEWSGAHSFLQTRPWNQQIGDARRVSSLYEFSQAIKTYNEYHTLWKREISHG